MQLNPDELLNLITTPLAFFALLLRSSKVTGERKQPAYTQ